MLVLVTMLSAVLGAVQPTDMVSQEMKSTVVTQKAAASEAPAAATDAPAAEPAPEAAAPMTKKEAKAEKKAAAASAAPMTPSPTAGCVPLVNPDGSANLKIPGKLVTGNVTHCDGTEVPAQDKVAAFFVGPCLCLGQSYSMQVTCMYNNDNKYTGLLADTYLHSGNCQGKPVPNVITPGACATSDGLLTNNLYTLNFTEMTHACGSSYGGVMPKPASPKPSGSDPDDELESENEGDGDNDSDSGASVEHSWLIASTAIASALVLMMS